MVSTSTNERPSTVDGEALARALYDAFCVAGASHYEGPPPAWADVAEDLREFERQQARYLLCRYLVAPAVVG